jgi:xanthine/uracil permease
MLHSGIVLAAVSAVLLNLAFGGTGKAAHGKVPAPAGQDHAVVH